MTTPQQNLSPQPPYPQAKSTNGAKAFAAAFNSVQSDGSALGPATTINATAPPQVSVVGGKFRVTGTISGTGTATNVVTVSLRDTVSGALISSQLVEVTAAGNWWASLEGFSIPIVQGVAFQAQLRAVAVAVLNVPVLQALATSQETPA